MEVGPGGGLAGLMRDEELLVHLASGDEAVQQNTKRVENEGNGTAG